MKAAAFGGSALLHGVMLGVTCAALSIAPVSSPVDSPLSTNTPPPPVPRLIFLAPATVGSGGGGGGGGNRQAGPIARAEDIGHDRATLRTRHSVATTGTLPLDEVRPPAVLLDARPLASGDSIQAGLPIGGVSAGTSLGSGSGGGVGTGEGTGIGPGRGPGLGPGSGGGIGGGAYRPGGSVTSPRLLVQVEPRYSSEALARRIQGDVRLEVVVSRSGVPTSIRVVGSLDPSLDEEAVTAVRRWRFAPGTLSGTPVDVEVVVIVGFKIY